MCDAHIDALSWLQSAITRGFSIESLAGRRALAQLYIDHRFITEDEADNFLSEIPVMGERDDESKGEITGHLFTDPDSDLGTLVQIGQHFPVMSMSSLSRTPSVGLLSGYLQPTKMTNKSLLQ